MWKYTWVDIEWILLSHLQYPPHYPLFLIAVIIGWFKRLGGRGRIRFNTSLECGLVIRPILLLCMD